MRVEEVERQVKLFVQYVQHGWSVETAFRTCHDAVYDLISADAFLDLCLEAVRKKIKEQQDE